MAGTANAKVFYQKTHHKTDEVTNRLQDGVKAAFERVGEALGDYATTAEVDAALEALPGAIIGVQVLFNGTTTYTPTPGTVDAVIEMWGGGGAGGGAAATGAATTSVGGGGGSGGFLRKRIAGIGAGPFTVAIGAGGTGVSGAAGNNGTATTFNDGTTTYTANGGFGGQASAAAGVVTFADGGVRASASSNGDVNGSGCKGGFGLVCTTTTGIGGPGAGTSLGGAPSGAIATGTGSAGGSNTGAGGGGAMGTNAGAQTGGAGANGLMVITEYA